MDDARIRESHLPDIEGGEHDPPGETGGIDAVFSAEAVADAFEVDVNRIYKALEVEFGVGPEGAIDSRQAQHLTDVVLGDQPQAEQEAALMRLGAYTPRRDIIEPSVSEKAEGELSDRIRSSEEVTDVTAPKEPGQ